MYLYREKQSGNGRTRASCALIGCEAEALQETEAAVQLLKQWMYQKRGERTDYVSGFLHKVDDFDLEQYIRAIHFDSLRVPKVPFTLPVSKHYYGLSEMRDGELDFLKHTVLAKSMEPVYLCSDYAGGGYGSR